MPKENQKFREGVKRILEGADADQLNCFVAAGIMKPFVLPVFQYGPNAASSWDQFGEFYAIEPKNGVHLVNRKQWFSQVQRILLDETFGTSMRGEVKARFNRVIFLPENNSRQAFPAKDLSLDGSSSEDQKENVSWLLIQLPANVMYRLDCERNADYEVKRLLQGYVPADSRSVRWLASSSLDGVSVEPLLYSDDAPCAQTFLLYKVVTERAPGDDKFPQATRQLTELISDCFVETSNDDFWYAYGNWDHNSYCYGFKEDPQMLVVELDGDLSGKQRSGNWKVGCLVKANMAEKLFGFMQAKLCYDHTKDDYKILGLRLFDEFISTEENPAVLDASRIIRFTEVNNTRSYKFKGLIMVPAQERHQLGIKIAGKEYVHAALSNFKNETALEKVLNAYLDVYDKEDVYLSDYTLEASEVCDFITIASSLQNKEILPKIISHAAEVDHKLLEDQDIVNVAAKGLVKFVDHGSYNLHVTRRNLPFLMLLTDATVQLRSEDAQYFSDKLCVRIHGFCRRHIMELLKEPELMTKISDHYAKFQYREYHEALLEFIEKNTPQ